MDVYEIRLSGLAPLDSGGRASILLVKLIPDSVEELFESFDSLRCRCCEKLGAS